MTAIPGEWADRAACKGKPADWWFPQPGRGQWSAHMYDRAKAICRTCEVITPCITFALDNWERQGMWGGKNPQELTTLRIRRRVRRVS